MVVKKTNNKLKALLASAGIFLVDDYAVNAHAQDQEPIAIEQPKNKQRKWVFQKIIDYDNTLQTENGCCGNAACQCNEGCSR